MAKFPFPFTTRSKKIKKITSAPGSTIRSWLHEKTKTKTINPITRKKKKVEEKKIGVNKLQRLLIQIMNKIDEIIDYLDQMGNLERMIIAEVRVRMDEIDTLTEDLRKAENRLDRLREELRVESEASDEDIRKVVARNYRELIKLIKDREIEDQQLIDELEEQLEEELDEHKYKKISNFIRNRRVGYNYSNRWNTPIHDIGNMSDRELKRMMFKEGGKARTKARTKPILRKPSDSKRKLKPIPQGNCAEERQMLQSLSGLSLEQMLAKLNGYLRNNKPCLNIKRSMDVGGSTHDHCPTICGDVSGDYTINVIDVVITVDIILNGGEYNACVDLNEDGVINVNDIILLINHILYGTVLSCHLNEYGCTIPDACNYNADATIDDGSCDYGTMCWDGSYECDAADCSDEPTGCTGIWGCDGVCHTTGVSGNPITGPEHYADLPPSAKNDFCGYCGGSGNNCTSCCTQLKTDCQSDPTCDWSSEYESVCNNQTVCYEQDTVQLIGEEYTVVQSQESNSECMVDFSTFNGTDFNTVGCTAGSRGGGKFQSGGNIEMATTPQEITQGLRGRTREQMPAEMHFPNSSGPFNTMGMKAPIDIEKYDDSGRLIESFKNVQPGIANIPMGNEVGLVIEKPTAKGGQVTTNKGQTIQAGDIVKDMNST